MLKLLKAGEKKRGNSIFIRSEPSLVALSPFSREMRQLSVTNSTGIMVDMTTVVMVLGDDDDDKVMMMSAATDNSGVDDEANSMTFFSR